MASSQAGAPEPTAGRPALHVAGEPRRGDWQAGDTSSASREWLRALFDGAPDAILVADADTGLLIDVNVAAERLLGLPREKLIGTHYLELHPPDTRTAAARVFQQMASGNTNTTQLEVLTVDGRRVPVEIVGGAVAVAGGRRIVEGFFRDVTDRRRAAEALRRSEERYRQLFELEADAVLVMELPSDRIVDASRRAERLYGYTRDELLALRACDLSAEPEATARSCQARDTYVPLRLHRRKDGTQFPVEIAANYFEDGGSALRIAAIRDISARLQTEAAQQETARQLDTLLNNLPGFAFRCRNDRDWTLDYISRGVEQLTGYPASDFVENRVRSYSSIIDPADQERVWFEVQKALRSGGTYMVEYRIHTANGEVRWVWSKGTGLRTGDQVTALEGFVTDITERRRAMEERTRLQAQFLQAQKMESIGRLAGGVAHDFNNLLTVILGYSDMLLSDSPPPPQRADLEQIRKAGDRARTLTRQLLAFSRKQVLELRRINLNQVVSDFSDMLRRLIGEQILVQTVLDPELGWVNADASQVVQVILNLAVNARDAMPRGGILTIRTANVSRARHVSHPGDGLGPGEYVQLEVSDTGCGMDAEVQKHVFEPFFTTKEVGKGSGLGLATVYGIVQQHGGHVAFSSQSGQGTSFVVSLPRAAPASSAGESVSAAVVAAAGGSESILLVEDDDDVRQMASLFLRRYGYQVIEAASPTAAIRLASAAPRLDLVLTDVVMPEMDGREVCERVAAIRPGIRALYMSGYAREVISPQDMQTDGVVFVQKPFSAPVLASKVREALVSAPPAFRSRRSAGPGGPPRGDDGH